MNGNNHLIIKTIKNKWESSSSYRHVTTTFEQGTRVLKPHQTESDRQEQIPRGEDEGYSGEIGVIHILVPYSDVSSGEDNYLPSPHYPRTAT